MVIVCDSGPREVSIDMVLSSCITLFGDSKKHVTHTHGWQSDMIVAPER